MSISWEPGEHKIRAATRPFVGSLAMLEQGDLEFFENVYELPEEWVTPRIRVEPVTQRYALPIFGPDYSLRGMVLREPWKQAPRRMVGHHLKADTYKDTDEPLQSFYFAYVEKRREPLVVVEDQLSAIKLSAYGYDAVAILGKPNSRRGNYTGSDRVAEISNVARRREVIVALDADAVADAFDFVRKWGAAFARCRVAILSRDLKDTPADDFEDVLGA